MAEKHDVCPASRAGTLGSPLRRLIQSPEKIVGPYIRSGDRVLDIGCGPGYFTRSMARMVGDEGCVIAADLQDEMLSILKQKAQEDGLLSRIVFHRTGKDSLKLNRDKNGPIDFALAFYVVHEVPDAIGLFDEVFSLLKQGGGMLVVEPRFHVGQKSFEEMLDLAKKAGFKLEGEPKVFFSRTALLKKPG